MRILKITTVVVGLTLTNLAEAWEPSQEYQDAAGLLALAAMCSTQYGMDALFNLAFTDFTEVALKEPDGPTPEEIELTRERLLKIDDAREVSSLPESFCEDLLHQFESKSQ